MCTHTVFIHAMTYLRSVVFHTGLQAVGIKQKLKCVTSDFFEVRK